jgi:predicted dehydrogenase
MPNYSDRRKFLKESAIKASSLGFLPFFENKISKNDPTQKSKITETEEFSKIIETKINFAVIGINHGHIYSMSSAIIGGGGKLVSFYALEDDLAAEFLKKFPEAIRKKTQEEILEAKDIQLILSASIPNERALVGMKAMLHGKDFMADKPGITSLKQLAEVKKIQKQTGRIYAITYSERFENRATVKAGELVKAGAIGKVIQTIGLGPHRMNTKSRPDWFFDKKYFGGIITDIASHQFDQFLFFTGSTEAKIVASQIGNVHHPQYPNFEDFGDVMVKGNKGTGYIRVDWFTPDGLKTWGDGRLTILGTEGFIEIRKNIDIALHDGGNHLYMANNKETIYIDCSKEPLPFGEQMVNDVINRTETAMSQAHCFLTMELALKAQKMAQKI